MIEVALACTIAGLFINIASFLRRGRKDGAESGKREADIDYIKRRTDDILLVKQTLFQLSYTPISVDC